MPVLQRLTVMVADHDPQRRILLVDCFNAIGIASVKAVGDGEQAFTVLMADPCDAVFTTLQLPRLNGAQLLKALREQAATRACCVILVAGDATSAEAHGFDGVLAKPFTPATVKAALEAVLGRLI
jgi:two-component system chemotaxis response regulator CheY